MIKEQKPPVSWNMKRTPAGLTIVFNGAITEVFDFDGVLNALSEQGLKSSERVLLDLGQLERMNSAGVRKWIRFLERLGSTHPARFLNVSEVVIDLVGITPQILGTPPLGIDAIEIPFICEPCSNRFFISTVLANPATSNLPPQSAPCPKCGDAAVVDLMENEYKTFIGLCKKGA